MGDQVSEPQKAALDMLAAGPLTLAAAHHYLGRQAHLTLDALMRRSLVTVDESREVFVLTPRGRRKVTAEKWWGERATA